MKRVDLSKPELFFIAATRAILGAGLGLLAADRIPKKKRGYVGAVLLGLGVLSTIPAALAVFRSDTKKTLSAAA